MQEVLFYRADRAKHDRLMAALVRLNSTYERHKVVPAVEGFELFKMNREHLLRKYATHRGHQIRVGSG